MDESKSENNIIYRQANIEDKDNLFQLYREVYPDQHEIKTSSLWAYEYLNNPNNEDDHNLSLWIALDENTGKIVGQSGVIYDKFKINTRTIKIGWGVDLVVHPQYRKKGIAINLQKTVCRDIDAYMIISMALSTRLMCLKLGARIFPEVFQLIFHVLPEKRRIPHYFQQKTLTNETLVNKVLRRIYKNNAFSSLIFNKVTVGFIRYLWKQKQKNVKQTENITFIDYENDLEIKNIINDLWKKGREKYHNLTYRDWEHFSWKYFDHPVKKHKVFLLKVENEFIGYLVLRQGIGVEKNVGIVTDYFLIEEQNDFFIDLSNFIINYFSNKEVDFIYLNTSVINHARLFQSAGFQKSRVHSPIFLSNDQTLYEAVDKYNNWFLTFSDHELDRYPVRGK